MAIHPNSLKNLINRKPFTPGDPRIKAGRKAGTLNRKTVFLKWLDFETDSADPAGNPVMLPIVDKVALAILDKACKGDISAAGLVFDSVYGKANLMPEAPPKQSIDWSKYTEEEVEQLTALMAKGLPDDAIGNEEIL